MRWLRGLRPVLGLAVMALAIVPWLYAIEHATEGRFLDQSLGLDFWSKVSGGQESHGAPPLYYLGLAFLTFWPGSVYLVPAVVGGWRRRAETPIRFLMAWLVPAWAVLELVPTKLPHYALPLYPALALLAAAAAATSAGKWRWAAITGAVVWGLATLLIDAALIVAPIRLGGGVMIASIASAIALIALMAVLFFRRPGPYGSTVLLVAMALALAVPAASWIVPNLDRLWLSRGAAALVDRNPPPAGTTLAVIGYNEPSLVFLLNDALKAQTADVPVPAGSEALVSSRDTAVFEQTTAARRFVARPIDSVGGTDYSNGQDMTLTLYQIEPR
jgi:4-amino-4-deoxy-L-arabinose transferase-like glycosyltransferase